VQNAKDTFYEMLRSRIMAGNADRTVVIRGATRPGVMVCENELEIEAGLPDCFKLTWGKISADTRGLLPMVAATCEVSYETAGTALNTGLDRGRMLAAMDGELLTALQKQPRVIAKVNYAPMAFGQSAVTMATNVWWGDVEFGAETVEADRLKRTATLTVLSYQEAGEV
jgi:hypothetical protein